MQGDSNREVLLDTFAVLAKSELAKRFVPWFLFPLTWRDTAAGSI